MVRLFNSFCFLGLVAAASAQTDPNEMADATCDNSCFFDFFTDKCNSDNPACVCTLNDMRNNYFCCLAKNCAPNVLPASIQRQTGNCNAWNIPIPSFDVEAVCGIKLPGTTTSAAPSTSVPNTSVSTSDIPPTTGASSSAVVSSTSAPSSTVTTPSNGTAPKTTKSVGYSTVATPSNGTAPKTTKSAGYSTTSPSSSATTSPAPGSGSRAALQGIPVVLGLGAFIAAML